MTGQSGADRPLLASFARYRWDKVRGQHQLVFPEGMMVLNDAGAAIVRLCDGRLLEDLIGALEKDFPDCNLGDDVKSFLGRLGEKGLLSDVRDS